MKKLLVLASLSVIAVSMSATCAQAWFLDCCRGCRGDQYTVTYCCRPYNAFSPPCCYPIGVHGAVPFNPYGGGFPPQQMPSGLGYPSYGPGCCTSGCCDVG